MQAVAHPSWVFCHDHNAEAFVMCSAKGFWTGEGWAAVLPDAKRFSTLREAEREFICHQLYDSSVWASVDIRAVRRV